MSVIMYAAPESMFPPTPPSIEPEKWTPEGMKEALSGVVSMVPSAEEAALISCMAALRALQPDIRERVLLALGALYRVHP